MLHFLASKVQERIDLRPLNLAVRLNLFDHLVHLSIYVTCGSCFLLLLLQVYCKAPWHLGGARPSPLSRRVR
jgi:hypothetical protein